MPITVSHVLSATTPDNGAYEIRPSHWNSGHNVTIAAVGSEISGAFSNGGNVAFALETNGKITASASGFAGTATAVTGAASITLNTAGLSFNGAGLAGTTSGFTGANLSASITHNTAGIAISLSAGNYLTTAAASNHSHGNPTLALTNLTGTTASASNGFTLSLSAAAPSAAAANINLLGANTAGNTTASGSTIGWSGVNVTLSGTNNSQIVVSGPASSSLSGTGALSISANADTISIGVPQLSLYASSNTTGQSSSSSYAIGAISLRAMGNMSIGNSAGELIFSCAAGGADGGIFASAAGSSQSAGNIIFSNSNGVSFGMNGSTITGSHNGLTSQSNQNVTAGNGGFAFQTLSFSNVNGISFGTSAGSAITASHNAITTGRASTDAIGLNTANTNVTWTVNSSGLSINAAGYAGTATGFTGANISGTFTHNSVGLSMSLSVAAPGAAAEANAINLLGANTAGNTTATGSTIGWSGINLTLSGTNNSQIVVSAPATSSLVGASGLTVSSGGSTISVGQILGSYFDNYAGLWPNSTTLTVAQSTSYFMPFFLAEPITHAFLRFPMTGSLIGASTTGVTTGNSQFSYGISKSHNFVLYSRGGGASSQSLMSVASTQVTERQSINVSANANSTQFSYTNRATYPMSTGPVGYTFDYSSSAASLNFHTSNMTAITGNKMMEFGWANSMTPGQYWLGYGMSSSSTSQYSAVGSQLFNRFSNYGMSQPNIAFGTIGADTNSSVGPFFGLGSFTTAGGGTTANLPISAITTSGSHNLMMFQLGRIA